jgi:hypothetical protein
MVYSFRPCILSISFCADAVDADAARLDDLLAHLVGENRLEHLLAGPAAADFRRLRCRRTSDCSITDRNEALELLGRLASILLALEQLATVEAAVWRDGVDGWGRRSVEKLITSPRFRPAARRRP